MMDVRKFRTKNRNSISEKKIFLVLLIYSLPVVATGCSKAIPYSKIGNVKEVTISPELPPGCLECIDPECAHVTAGASFDGSLNTQSSVQQRRDIVPNSLDRLVGFPADPATAMFFLGKVGLLSSLIGLSLFTQTAFNGKSFSFQNLFPATGINNLPLALPSFSEQQQQYTVWAPIGNKVNNFNVPKLFLSNHQKRAVRTPETDTGLSNNYNILNQPVYSTPPLSQSSVFNNYMEQLRHQGMNMYDQLFRHENNIPQFNPQILHYNKNNPKLNSQQLGLHYNKNNPKLNSQQLHYNKNNPKLNFQQLHYNKNNPKFNSQQLHYNNNNPELNSQHKNNPEFNSQPLHDNNNNPEFNSQPLHDNNNNSELNSQQLHYDKNNPEFNSQQLHYDSNNPEFNSQQLHYNSNNPEFNSQQLHYDSNNPEFSSQQLHYDSNNPEFSSQQLQQQQS